MSTSDEELLVQLVTNPYPIDVSSIRDPGMKALVVLAASLGWNVQQKHNKPVMITARDGFRKSIPTNTSIRISVFQTTLASIILYSQDAKPSEELIEKIIRSTKLDADHARRLRLVLGESDAVLADRVMNATKPGQEEEEVTEETDDTKEPQWKTAIEAMQPTELLDRRPTPPDWDQWNEQLRNLPYVMTAERKGISTKLTFTSNEYGDDGVLWWCSFPGCRVYGVNLYSVRGHSRVHTAKWGSLSDSQDAKRRIANYHAARAREAEATEITFTPLKTVEVPYSPVSSEPEPEVAPALGADIIDRYTNDALALLDIANRFVADLDQVTEILTRILGDSEEVVALRLKAAKYDKLMEVLGNG